MRISFRHKYVMFDIPKSASTSINYAIRHVSECILDGNGGIKHINVSDYEEFLEPLLVKRAGIDTSTLERIAVVRDPLDMLKSYYTYLQRPGVKNPQHVDHRRSTANMQFDEFIEIFLDEQSGKRKPVFRVSRPSGFLKDHNGQIGVDSIFSFDDLELLAVYMSEKTGTHIEIEKKNVSTSKVESQVSDSLLGKIREVMAEDFRLYDAIASAGGAHPLRIERLGRE